MNLAASRSKALASRRNDEKYSVRNPVLAQVRAEGYEDYSWQAKLRPPYKGDELAAYLEGWNQAKLEMTGEK